MDLLRGHSPPQLVMGWPFAEATNETAKGLIRHLPKGMDLSQDEPNTIADRGNCYGSKPPLKPTERKPSN
ncbi:MAG: hypothetical protein ACKN9T_05050 [Candidatus Methylumidiphilus sp.]